MSSTAVAEARGPRPEQTGDRRRSAGDPTGPSGSACPACTCWDGDRDRPARPPLLAGLDLHLDRRAAARVFGRGRTAHGATPRHRLAADHRRAARLRPAARRGGRKPAPDPLAAAGGCRQGPRTRTGPDRPPPGRALHAGPPAFLGLRGVLLLVLPLLRDAARGGRDLALRVQWFHRFAACIVVLAAMGLVTYVLFPAAPPWLAGGPRLHRSHLPDHPRSGEQPAGAEGRGDVPEGDGLGERRCRGAVASRGLHDVDLPLPLAASIDAGGRCWSRIRSGWGSR